MKSEPRDLWCLPVGLAGLFVWLVGGVVLESLHIFKTAAYLEDDVRRLLWTLAHAHGTLFSALCVIVSKVVPDLPLSARARRTSDRLFAAGSVILPLGFLLGGIVHTESDPGVAVLLVPIGAAAAGIALLIWLGAWFGSRGNPRP